MMRTENYDRRRLAVARGGMTLIEVTAAAAMLAVLIGSSVQVMRVLGTQQRAAERQMVALQTAQSLVEQLGNTAWDEVTPAAADALVVPAAMSRYLPGAKLVATVADEQDPTAAKRLTIELTWNAPNGQPAAPVRLTTWVFPDEIPVEETPVEESTQDQVNE